MNTNQNYQFTIVNPQKVNQMLNEERLAKQKQEEIIRQLEAERKESYC